MSDEFYSLMSKATGLSTEEIRWTGQRLWHLMMVENKPSEEAKEIVRIEAREKFGKAVQP